MKIRRLNSNSMAATMLVAAFPLLLNPAVGQDRQQALTPENALTLAELLNKDWKQKPEWAEMLTSILNGESMGANSGWFKPSEKRLGWKWFAAQFDKNKDDKVSPDEGRNFAKVFAAIDKNGDGGITQVDFDWDDVSHVGPTKPSEAIFFLLDRDSNGRVDQQEIMQWMGSMDENRKGYLTPDEFTKGFAMLDQFQARQKSAVKDKPAKSKQPKQDPNRMMNMLFSGELGSFSEGPAIGNVAPDFELQQLKASEMVKLSSYRGKQIVVLNFGSFT